MPASLLGHCFFGINPPYYAYLTACSDGLIFINSGHCSKLDSAPTFLAALLDFLTNWLTLLLVRRSISKNNVFFVSFNGFLADPANVFQIF